MEAEHAERLRAFVREWRAHVAREEAERRWMSWATASLVCLAVASTLCGLRFGGVSSESIRGLNRAAAASSESTQAWSIHEMRRVRAYLFELHHERLALDLRGARRRSPREVVAEMEQHVEKYRQLAEEHARRRQQQLQVARDREARADAALLQAIRSEHHVNGFALAVTIFQGAVAFVSLSLILRRRWPWYAGLGIGALGLAQALNAQFLWLV